MIALLLAGGVALIVSLVATPVFIRWLQAEGIGQQIREDGPEGHITKAGTPTMGGLMIVIGALAGYLAGHLRSGAIFTRGGLLVAFAVAGAGLVGLVDDWIKVRRRRSLGLNKRAKIAGQLLVAGGFALLALELADVKTDLSFTRFDSIGLDLGTVGWVVWTVVVMIGTSNAVNLTDGLDGLAAGSATFSFSAFAIIGFWQFRHFGVYQVPQALDLALLAISLTGACAGFLWWNAAPARIFMGDTGSLAIGAGLAALALLMNLQLLLPVIGGLYVLETVSVIVQVASFRIFHRRIFRMAPVHHHFELAGWPETTVIVRFWILAGLCTALALGLFYADFISLGVLD
ncbi:MAG: phospho-N-acetylmuramoyl-pentapeptide-transferase [Actinomycetota bacterium]|nr:phospho-N-acetylmuramoyl-pentapeptide-transferase [Actinomycetota bacterium]PLS76436.1 MAG: phospho-N-acetylmuramoyl-pentapeptide-transferase [Actinomycetota bacterium]